jgi:hypothetical protein
MVSPLHPSGMDYVTRQDLGEVLGWLALFVVGAALCYLLHPISRRGRGWRAAAWFCAWSVAGWVFSAVDVAVAGVHQVHRQRETGGWYDVHVGRTTALAFALFIGAFAAGLALWSPGRRPTSSTSQAGRSARPRRKAHRAGG